MILHGDSLHVLEGMTDESVDLLCTDPPYGYSFMGKSWDKTLPDIGIFEECLRVLKPGAFAFVMSAPRSDVCARMMLLLEDAGFNIGFTPIYWTYASGFPKAMNIGKMVDKRAGAERPVVRTSRQLIKNSMREMEGRDDRLPDTFDYTAPATPEAKALDGSYGGFQPKPAVEVIIVAMKPLSEKTYVDQALKNGKGITWLDDCRVPTKPGDKGEWPVTARPAKTETYDDGLKEHALTDQNKGRFPANLLVSDDVLNDGMEQKSGIKDTTKAYNNSSDIAYSPRGDAPSTCFADSGSYSRFFDLDAWAKTLPFLIVPKASKSEKNAGLEAFEEREAIEGAGGHGSLKCTKCGRQQVNVSGACVCPEPDFQQYQVRKKNFHPTVKPLKLMSYLITLGSRPGDTILDPFLGSGTTAIAAKQLGRECIGIEREEEYVEIARARLEAINPTLI